MRNLLKKNRNENVEIYFFVNENDKERIKKEDVKTNEKYKIILKINN